MGCAGDGDASTHPFTSSWLISAFALPYAGVDLSRSAGDPGDAAVRLGAGSARLGACGRLRLGKSALIYSLAYEPYGAEESARVDSSRWGRILAAEAGFPIVRWLTLHGGVRKVAFSYGHDESEQSLALPVRPFLSNSLAPDRRLGVTLDDNWGPSRVLVGIYESARTFAEFPSSDILVVARGVMEPIGPVGRSISTVNDDPYWIPRFRVAINISTLLQWDPRPNASLGYAIGGDLPIKFGPLGLVVEYLYAKNTGIEDTTAPPGARADRQGLWAQAALMLLRPYVELEGRYEWFDLPSDEKQQFHALTGGLTAYVQGGLLKLQAAYGHRFHYAGPTVQDDYLLLEMQTAR